MIAELHEFRRFAADIMTFKQIADALLTRDIVQDFVAGIVILTAADLLAHVELHGAILDADALYVGGIAFAVIGFNILEGFTLILFRFLPENRIQFAFQ